MWRPTCEEKQLKDWNKIEKFPLRRTFAWRRESIRIFISWCTSQVQGTYYLRVGDKANAPRWRRSYGQQILSPLQLAFTVYEVSSSSFAWFCFNFHFQLDHVTCVQPLTWFSGLLFDQDTEDAVRSAPKKFSVLKDGYQLPPNVALITLQVRRILLRQGRDRTVIIAG